MNLLVSLFLALLPSDYILVSSGPAPFQYPTAVYSMTPEEFRQWAIDFNTQQLQESEQRSARGPSMYLEGYRTDYSPGSVRTIPTRYLNPDYTGPGPLWVINPFCPPEK